MQRSQVGASRIAVCCKLEQSTSALLYILTVLEVILDIKQRPRANNSKTREIGL